jgi:hypothetical protein
MRKLVATELVSLDGVMQSPEEWTYSYSNDEMGGERIGHGRSGRHAVRKSDLRRIRILLATRR